MNIEQRCRGICIANKINPDADAPEIFQTMPGFKKNDDGRVKQWHTWISTIEITRAPTRDQFTSERAESHKTIKRIINETDQKDLQC